MNKEDILDSSKLSYKMKTRWAGRNLECYPVIGSTNDRAKELAKEGGVHGSLIIADAQTAGRGRRGKSWSGDAGTNIYMSMILRPQIPPECAPMLTLVAALAVSGGIEETAKATVQIKWPNDIIAAESPPHLRSAESNGCKICGILTEMSADMDLLHYAIVGIGINVNTTNFDEEIQNTATSLYKLTGKMTERGDLVVSIMKFFEKYYEEFMKYKNLTPLMDEFNSKLINFNNKVRILAPGKEYTGTALGITSLGELMVQTETGEIKNVLSGEVSVRGVYGYV